MWSRLIKKGIIRHGNTKSPKIRTTACLRKQSAVMKEIGIAAFGRLYSHRVDLDCAAASCQLLFAARLARTICLSHRSRNLVFCSSRIDRFVHRLGYCGFAGDKSCPCIPCDVFTNGVINLYLKISIFLSLQLVAYLVQKHFVWLP